MPVERGRRMGSCKGQTSMEKNKTTDPNGRSTVYDITSEPPRIGRPVVVRPLRNRRSGGGYVFMGTGVRLGTWSRLDREGKRFAVRWISLFGMPLLPIGRFYLKPGSSFTFHSGNGTKTTTLYTFYGRAGLQLGEILRSYVYFWVACPAVIVGPMFLIRSTGWNMLWFFAGIFIIGMIGEIYKQQFSPLYEPLFADELSQS